MSTVPDLRDMPIPTAPKGYTPIGYVCATVIVCVMLCLDGVVAIATASAVAGTMVGITVWNRMARS